MKGLRRRPLGVDDRSGFVVPLHTLRKEWTGLKVSDDEYEDKHPQLRRRKIGSDQTRLREPRPDNYRAGVFINLYTNGTDPLVASAWIGGVEVEIA